MIEKKTLIHNFSKDEHAEKTVVQRLITLHKIPFASYFNGQLMYKESDQNDAIIQEIIDSLKTEKDATCIIIILPEENKEFQEKFVAHFKDTPVKRKVFLISSLNPFHICGEYPRP